jgi:hypothetical protein
MLEISPIIAVYAGPGAVAVAMYAEENGERGTGRQGDRERENAE